MIEARELMRAIGGGGRAEPDFRAAWEIARVIDAVLLSSERGRWVGVGEVGRPA